ncbi:hypothetical protein IMZ48_33910 [Candidatus Bathyarchaeota archaeon]|nr:hypothetical protein [Candidatus Bathyarchaeota archaeon]
MLVTDPKQRATMQEVLSHPWMTKGYPGPPENHLPPREPLTVPLDQETINAMTGFNFGSPETIKAQLARAIESDEYQRALRLLQREREHPQPSREVEKRRGFGFDFYRRRSSGNSRDTLSTPSTEGLQLGSDPLNAYSPLISIYYLVREKKERERADAKSVSGQQPTTKEAGAVPEPSLPQEAHTNSTAYEIPGETPTGHRPRPRARTHGEEDMPESARKRAQSPPVSQTTESRHDGPQKKEGTAAGLLRRFSTRKRRDHDRAEKDRSHPPVVQVHSPTSGEPSPIPRKSFSIRRSRDEAIPTRLRSGSSQPQHSDLLSPPPPADAGGRQPKRALGRSTSVNSADLRSRGARGTPKDPPPTSGSDHERTRHDHVHTQSSPMRAKSIGHARRESIQRRRLRREEAKEANVPEETDQDLADHSGVSTDRLDSSDLAKPVFLKGLFSVSTTSPKSVPEILAEMRRVLKRLGVEYSEIKGGFACRHTPSIDLKKVTDPPTSPSGQTSGHRRRFSFGGLINSSDRERDDVREFERGPQTPRTPNKAMPEGGSNSDISEGSGPLHHALPSRRAAGETTTQVQSDLGGSMVLEFEIFIVKVPLLSLHGIQFKRMAGNTWQYKNMADQILKEVRL